MLEHKTAGEVYGELYTWGWAVKSWTASGSSTLEWYHWDRDDFLVLMDLGVPLEITRLTDGWTWEDDDYREWQDAQEVDLAQSEYTDWRG